ncbi:glutaminase [Notoacmeibacter ruber]|uniref:Glutaminase n=1 Tax=Notoacmeibacter ruber TaxID=2670375 RepID=A0A3L7JDN0_9HYPH|nr:glutaminase [Notoacmeibacter ruber]RLQ88877.1 glutaminase [Notoacmeibacter ruber]
MTSIPAILDEIRQKMACAEDRGKAASYIPELASADLQKFAISVCLPNGEQWSTGDSRTPFSIQSVSKVFTLAIALGRYGESLWRRVGREPTTKAFNSSQELEVRKGIPANPFVNAGAIVTTDMVLKGASPAEALGGILQFLRVAASEEDIHINRDIAASEKMTGHKNWALAHLLSAYGNLDHSCELTLGTYFHQCAIEMSCEELARSGRFLAGFGKKDDLVRQSSVKRINALMLTCGHYNGSGEFAYRVGIPAKSGVGGAILAIVPGKASIAVWSPGLDEYGNSLLGTAALEELSNRMEWSVFS